MATLAEQTSDVVGHVQGRLEAPSSRLDVLFGASAASGGGASPRSKRARSRRRSEFTHTRAAKSKHLHTLHIPSHTSPRVNVLPNGGIDVEYESSDGDGADARPRSAARPSPHALKTGLALFERATGPSAGEPLDYSARGARVGLSTDEEGEDDRSFTASDGGSDGPSIEERAAGDDARADLAIRTARRILNEARGLLKTGHGKLGASPQR